MFTLECCVDSVESALEAKLGGADRLELCSNLLIGGTTPSVSLFQLIREKIDLPIHELIRPRIGDFCYTDFEFEVIRREVLTFNRLGANGVVIGILTPTGALDRERMKILMEAVGKIDIMAGGGLNASMIKEMHQYTGVTCFHTSGKVDIESVMVYRNSEVSMGSSLFNEYLLQRTHHSRIHEMKDILGTLC